MRKARLQRSTPFRLALTFSLLFMLAFVLAGFVVYQVLRADLGDRLDETVRSTFSVVAATYNEGDLEDLVAAVQSHASLSDTDEELFSLVDAAGKHLAGDFNAPPLPAGFSTLRGASLNPAKETDYRALSGNVGPNVLTVALSYGETEELESVLLASFGWTAVIVLGLSVVGGILLATQVQKRLDSIGATMVNVSHGNLSARIPLTGRDDDIDEMSGQVNAALDRLSALVDGMKQVSADIAHDLKTPLNRLQIGLEALAAKVADGSVAEPDVAEVQNEARNINDTFEALLRIAQIEAGARKERFAEVQPADIVNDLAETYVEVAAESGMSLAVDLPAHPIQAILGDRQLLLQLFANLVENAIRHCQPGASIRLGLRLAGTQVTLSVSDDGPGIPADEREKVFQRLYRLEKSRTTAGSGLGLSMVKAIADLHGATVTLEDNKPGLLVAVRFPARSGPAE